MEQKKTQASFYTILIAFLLTIVLVFSFMFNILQNYSKYSGEWQDGRQLAGFNHPTYGFNGYLNYYYDYQGLRTQKHVMGSDTYYFWVGNRLVAEKTGQVNKWFYYDESGVCGMQYGGIDYIFEKNILGDVVGVYRMSDGVYIGGYTYNAWGYPLSMKDAAGNEISQYANHALAHNPFRYRSYYFDKETYFYYLESRYYDPQFGRFLNADEPSMLYYTGDVTFGANLYAYCLNNPVMYTDSTGGVVDFVLDIIFAVASLVIAICDPSVENWVAFGADVGAIFVPFATGAGFLVRGGVQIVKGVDKAIDVGKGIKKIDNITYYRGGKDMTLKPKDYRLGPDGLVKTTHGISINKSPNGLDKFGGAYRVGKLPNGLKITQRGNNLNHFEIVPSSPMSLQKYQSLLYKIKLYK